MLEVGSYWTTEIRPGIVFPDWSVIRSPQEKGALAAILDAFGAEACWRDYSTDEDKVRSIILRRFVEAGRSPSLSELMSATGMADDALQNVLGQLRQRDLVVIDGERIVGAYPLTDRTTDHEIRIRCPIEKPKPVCRFLWGIRSYEPGTREPHQALAWRPSFARAKVAKRYGVSKGLTNR